MSITNLESKCWFCQEEDIKVSNSEKIQLINEKTKEIYKTFIYRCDDCHQKHLNPDRFLQAFYIILWFILIPLAIMQIFKVHYGRGIIIQFVLFVVLLTIMPKFLYDKMLTFFFGKRMKCDHPAVKNYLEKGWKFHWE